jgi:hypothetical protein
VALWAELHGIACPSGINMVTTSRPGTRRASFPGGLAPNSFGCCDRGLGFSPWSRGNCRLSIADYLLYFVKIRYQSIGAYVEDSKMTTFSCRQKVAGQTAVIWKSGRTRRHAPPSPIPALSPVPGGTAVLINRIKRWCIEDLMDAL